MFKQEKLPQENLSTKRNLQHADDSGSTAHGGQAKWSAYETNAVIILTGGASLLIERQREQVKEWTLCFGLFISCWCVQIKSQGGKWGCVYVCSRSALSLVICYISTLVLSEIFRQHPVSHLLQNFIILRGVLIVFRMLLTFPRMPNVRPLWGSSICQSVSRMQWIPEIEFRWFW